MSFESLGLLERLETIAFAKGFKIPMLLSICINLIIHIWKCFDYISNFDFQDFFCLFNFRCIIVSMTTSWLWKLSKKLEKEFSYNMAIHIILLSQPDRNILKFCFVLCFLSFHLTFYAFIPNKQVAQRATIAHLSPMCQGQISFQKHINGPWKPEARNQTHPGFYVCPGYQQLWWWLDQKWMS